MVIPGALPCAAGTGPGLAGRTRSLHGRKRAALSPAPPGAAPAPPAVESVGGPDALRGAGLPAARPVAVVAVLASDEEPRGDDGGFALVPSERGPRGEALCAAMLERMQLVATKQGVRPRFARRTVSWMVTPPARQLAKLSDVSCP